MAERYQLPRSCVPPMTRRKDCGHSPSGGSEGGKTRCIREREDMVAFQGVTLLLKATLPTCVPSRRGLSLLQHAPRSSPYSAGLGPTRHASWPRAEEAKPPRAVHATAQRLQAFLHFRPDQRVKGQSSVQAACNRAKWARPSDFQRTQHGGPGPRIMQPARQLLHASNRATTCATVAPLRLRSLCRDSRRPSSASLARWSKRPKVGQQ